MEKIIQIAASDLATILLTNEGRVFFKEANNPDWIESSLPPLHTNEIDHANESHSCTQCTAKFIALKSREALS